MKPTQKLHDIGQSLWLDNITRDMLTGGTLKRYIDELSVTGLTSNPTIFDQAITHSTAYGLPGSFGAKTYVISSSLLDTSLRNLSSDMAEVVGIVAIIVGKTEGFA